MITLPAGLWSRRLCFCRSGVGCARGGSGAGGRIAGRAGCVAASFGACMLCQRCGEREATIHEVVIRNGVPRETHLCESCAGPAGLSGIAGASVAELLPGLLAAGVTAASGAEPGEGSGVGKSGGTPASGRAQACDSCGMTFQDFKRTGLLGCPRCYEIFEDKVGPLIERAHDGGTHHVGKIPRRALAASREGAGHRLAAMLGDQKERAERLTQLRKQLDSAVKSEQYERAAAIRDEMRRLSVLGVIGDEENGAGNGGSGGSGEGSP